MNKITYLAIDDQESCISELKALLSIYPEFECIGTAKSVTEAGHLFRTTNPNIAFCDISLGKNKIFEILTEEIFAQVTIVFITGSEEFALKALRLSAFDYIVKPVEYEELKGVISKYYLRNQKNVYLHERLEALEHNLNSANKNKKIAIYSGKGYIFRNIHDLIYIEGKNNYCELFFIDGASYTLSKTLLSQEENLEPYGFFRIHQSYIVNLAFVLSFNSADSTVLLTTNQELPVSAKKRNALFEKLKVII